MNVRPIIVAVTITAAVITKFAVDDSWQPDWKIIVGLLGWSIVAAVTAYKVRIWIRDRDDD